MEKIAFWSPIRLSIGSFLLLIGVAYGYEYFSGHTIYWLGLIMMLVMYSLTFYIGMTSVRKKTGKTDDMLVAGRSMPLWISIFTMTATWVGGGYITGTAESVYHSGFVWTQAPWCYAVSLIIGGIFYARRMRRYEFMTMIDPLEVRFGKKMASLLYIPALLGEIFWSAAVLTALGTTFGVILGLSFSLSIVFSAMIALAYTVIGGLWAVAHTDVFQLSVMFFGLLLCLPFAFGHVGGVHEAVFHYTLDMKLFPPLMGWKDPAWRDLYWKWWDMALLLIFGGIPWQSYFQRVLSSKTERVAMWHSVFAGILCALAAIPPALIGIAGFNANWSTLGTQAPKSSSMILTYVFKYMTPDIVGAFALGGLAAAVLAAVAASMLSASGMAAWNVYRPLIKPQASQKHLDKMIKRSIIIIGTAATIIALSTQSVYALWYLSSDLVYVILFPQLTIALFYKGANAYGSLAGFVVSLVLRLGGGEPLIGLPSFIPYPMVHGNEVLFPFRTFSVLCGFLIIIIISFVTRRLLPPVSLKKHNSISN